MRTLHKAVCRILPVVFALLWLAACKDGSGGTQRDTPRLTPKVSLHDITLHSTALNRDVQYRVVLPAAIGIGQKLPVVYLLHGGGGNFRNWTNWSDVARYAENGSILVMPDGGNSYWTNSAGKPQDRYEDYIVQDLIPDVEAKFPAATGRSNRAIAGVSMGGFGAVKIALRHPELFVFAGGISSSLDVPSRPFSIKRPAQWMEHRSVFGPWGGESQRENDPYELVRTADPTATPFLFLTCGEQEGLLAANRIFAGLLERSHFAYEFHVVPGGHTWTQWNERLPSLFESMLKQLSQKN